MTRQRTGAPTGQAVARTTACRKLSRVFAALPSQVGEARRFVAGFLSGCPVAGDAILCLSELAANACLHSASLLPGGVFTVRILVRDGDHVRIEVADNGGPWTTDAHADDWPHGLAIVAALASESGRCGDPETGWLAWATLNWPKTAEQRNHVANGPGSVP
jgi:hypothetical protein